MNKHIGYDRAATIAKHAQNNAVTLREAVVTLGEVSEAQFDKWVRPERMV